MKHRPAQLTAEQSILLTCARNKLEASHVEIISESVKRGVDLDRLWISACRHGIGYFVAQHLRTLAESDASLELPANFLTRMRKEVWQMAVRSLELFESQRRLESEFTSAYVPVLWLKGLALSDQLYGRIEARQSGDLDLLVRPADLEQAEKCLFRAGYSPLLSSKTGKDQHVMNAHHTTWSFCDSAIQPLPVELHHRLSGPADCQPPADDWFRRSRNVQVRDAEFRVPSRVDELVLLCLHAHHHNFGHLRNLMDIAEYWLRFGSEINKETLMLQAQESRCAGRVGAAFALAKRAIQPKLPSLNRLLRTRQRHVTDRMPLTALLDVDGDDNDFRRLRLSLLMDGWRDTLRLIGPHIFPPRDYVRIICPQPWGNWPGVARVYHVGRLVWRAWARACSLK